MKRKLTRDKVISLVNGKQLVGVYWEGTDGSEILFECSPEKADKIIEIFNGGAKERKRILGKITVDSGQVIIVDPCYLDGNWVESKEGKGKYGGGTYEKCCKLSDSRKMGGELIISPPAGKGVVSETGVGDGVYPIEAIVEDDRIAELRIRFL